MTRYRTFCLLLLAAFCGIGAGVLATFSGGLLPIYLFVAFPFVVAALFSSIMYDVAHQSAGSGDLEETATLTEGGHSPTSHRHKAA
jgi:hypothetical protein